MNAILKRVRKKIKNERRGRTRWKKGQL
jgi:hypothetical protein